MLAELCPPALIYLIFSTTQIVIDTIKGFYNTAFLKIWVTFAFTVLLNFLCSRGLGIVSWIIVFIPFILMTLIISILLIMFGLDPSTGKSKVYSSGSGSPSPNKLIGGCSGTQFGCCANGTSAKSLNDPCKSSVPGVPQTMVNPIIIPPDGIQRAYTAGVSQTSGTPVGSVPQGPFGEVPVVSEVPEFEGRQSSEQQALDNQKNTRAYQQPTLKGEQPSERAGDVNSNCQTFCNKGTPCTAQCKSWKCPNCIPPAPSNLSTTCKTASSACNTTCSQSAADACLVDDNYLDPRTECIGWAPCMILNKINSSGFAGGVPAGSPKHASLDKLP